MTNLLYPSPACTLLYGLICEYSQKISTNASHCGFIKLRLRSVAMERRIMLLSILANSMAKPHLPPTPAPPTRVQHLHVFVAKAGAAGLLWAGARL